MKDDFSIKGEVIAALESINNPGSEQSIVDAHLVENVVVKAGIVDLTLVIDATRKRDERFALEDAIADAVEAISGVREVQIKSMTPEALAQEQEGHAPSAPKSSGTPALGTKKQAAPAPKQATMPASEPIEGVGRVIAVASGKGGVGKSTVAVNLALALQKIGYRVGLLDIDIYGPSLPVLLGVNGRPEVDNRRILPLKAAGLSVMSLGFLMEDDTPVIWRGPIVTGIIRQFLRDVDWSGIDYLVVDMPPGTGDAQLALAQAVPVDGAVIVTTPSDLALVDAARGLQMFKTLNIGVIGIVANMSKFVHPTSGEVFHIFGDPAVVGKEAERLETAYLGDIPLDLGVRKGGDEGRPIVIADPDSAITAAFVELAEKVAASQPVGQQGEEPVKKKGLFSFLKS